MVIKEKTTITVTCDECGKEVETKQRVEHGYHFMYLNKITLVPKGWIFLEKIKLRWNGGKKEKEIDIDEDPQFCCKECLRSFISKQIDSIK